ncbi:MAG TPA: carboxypeptidase-like regulatory domain-containing protein, partial [Puia sp.]|nr:carboxypeptidase-like regulatory domain-containing protein [Puia sp.]
MNRKLRSFLFLLFCFFCYHSLLAGKPAEYGTITGTITDKAGKPIAGATITIPDLKTGTVSDENGKFTLTLGSRGIHLVEVSYVGYSTFYHNVDFSKTAQLDVQLTLSTIETEEVVVTGVSRATEMKRAPIPIIAVGKEYLEQRSGATNIIDAVANLPGVSAVTTG